MTGAEEAELSCCQLLHFGACLDIEYLDAEVVVSIQATRPMISS